MEGRKEVSGLVERWQTVPSFRVRDVFVGPDEPPFGRTGEGLLDLRGVPIEGAVHMVEAVGVDFAHSQMGTTGQLGGGFRASRCRFDRCKYQSALDGVFEHCRFLASNLADSTVREVFVSCDLTEANMSRVRGSQVTFRSCTFISTNFVKACLYDCRFIDCRFQDAKFGRGSFAGSVFTDCEFVGIDWKDTILDRVSGVPSGPGLRTSGS